MSAAFQPTFAKYPLQKTTYASRGGDATIICQPEAAPVSVNTWEKNGQDLSGTIGTGGRMTQLPNGNLYITDLQNSDEGEYTCVATNMFGSAESTGQLKVLGKSINS